MKKTSFVSYIQVGLLAALVYGLFSLNENLDGIKSHLVNQQQSRLVYQVVGKYRNDWTLKGFLLKGNEGYRTVAYDTDSRFDKTENIPEFVEVIDRNDGTSPSVHPLVITK